MGKPDDSVTDYGKPEAGKDAEASAADAVENKENAAEAEKPVAEQTAEVKVQLIPIQKGLEKIAEGGWYLDRYRSAVITKNGGLPNDLIYITDSVSEANRRYDSELKTWTTEGAISG